MARISIIDRADMNAEQARVYDAAKQSTGIVGGPYYAYIRLPAFVRGLPGSAQLSRRPDRCPTVSNRL